MQPLKVAPPFKPSRKQPVGRPSGKVPMAITPWRCYARRPCRARNWPAFRSSEICPLVGEAALCREAKALGL